MRRATRATIASLAVLGVATFGCATDADPDPDAGMADASDEPGPDEPGSDEPATDQPADGRIDQLEAELAEVRDRVDGLDLRTEALEQQLGEQPSEPDTEAARPRTPEGLIDQLRVHVRDLDALPDEFEPGVTDWTSFEVPDEVDGTYDTPGEVVAELAAVTDAPQLGTDVWETTIRVLLDEDDPDLAYGAVLSWGFLDDSVEGRDVRVTLTRTDDDRWEPGGAEQRFHCMRGVTDDGELCI